MDVCLHSDIQPPADLNVSHQHRACVSSASMLSDHDWKVPGAQTIYSFHIGFPSFSTFWTQNHNITEHHSVWFIGKCDRNWQLSFRLLFLALKLFFLHFLFPLSSPGCRFNSHKIQKYLFFYIVNLSVFFFFMSNSPDCAAHSSWAALRAARLWCFSSCSSDWSVSCRVSSKPPLSVHSF